MTSTRSLTITYAAAMKLVTLTLSLLLLAACQPGNSPRPVPSVAQIGADLHCSTGDHGYEDAQAGWGFCYPGTWKYNERAQSSTNPPGLDLTFDITDVPCTSPPPGGAGSPSVRPVCSPQAGLFAFMIISTYERGSSPDLASWIQANLVPHPSPSTSPTPGRTPSPAPSPPAFEPIQWGNATEAGRFADGRRIALTQGHVVILDMRSGVGQLDLEAQMSTRLGTWKFTA